MARFIRHAFCASKLPEVMEVSYQSTGIQGGDSSRGARTELEFALGVGAHSIRIESQEKVLYEIDTRSGDSIRLRLVAEGDFEIMQLDTALHEIGAYCARDAAKNKVDRLERNLEEAKQQLKKLSNLY